MTDVPSDQNNPWPFIGISVLVLLLGAFLWLRMAGEEEPELPVVATPLPKVEPQPVEKPSEKVEISREKEDEEKRTALLTAAHEALSRKDFGEALAAIAEAREIRPSDDLDELQKEISGLRDVFAKEQEERDRFAVALLELSDRWETEWRKQDLWDTAVEGLGAFEKAQPRALEDPDYKTFRRGVLDHVREMRGDFKINLARAVKFQEAGNIVEALRWLGITLSNYPEKAGELKKLRAEWERVVHDRNMVRVGDVEVRIGDDAHEDEKPARSFKGKVFWIDQYEVTNEDYAAFLLSRPDHPAPPSVAGWNRRMPPKGRGKHPVTFVSHADAAAYARWAGKRLPTADEWEKAARFRMSGTWPWGDEFPPPGADDYLANSAEYWHRYKTRRPGPLSVGSFPAGKGELDLYDLAGNVWEWTSTKVVVEEEGKKVEMMVLKGGSFMTSKEALRCSNRLLDPPMVTHPDTGFRCVRD